MFRVFWVYALCCRIVQAKTLENESTRNAGELLWVRKRAVDKMLLTAPEDCAYQKKKCPSWRIVFVCWVLLLSGPAPEALWDDWASLRARGELVLITRNNEACYFNGLRGYTGFEYDLVSAFARDHDLFLRVEVVETETEMVDAIQTGKGDIIAAGIPFGRRHAGKLAMGPGYLEMTHQVVGRRGNGVSNTLTEADLPPHTLWMTDSSARSDTLEALRTRIPDLTWKIPPAHHDSALLQMVASQALPLVLVDSPFFLTARHRHPELEILMDLGPPRMLAWATHPRNRHLLAAIEDWFRRDEVRDLIGDLKAHYFEHLEFFDYVDLKRYQRRIREELPRYRPLFERAGNIHDVDWRLLAAQAYQESHWNPKATSYTGVRGIMMLTRKTAAAMGLENRLDPEGSIMAGAKYLALLHDQIGTGVSEPDRTFMALAAYNMGPGHLEDARMLAIRLGKSANRWAAVRSVLPLLQEPEYYETLPNRFARGQEAVSFVDRIRIYYQVLRAVHKSGKET